MSGWVLETDRLRLRRFRAADAGALSVLHNDPRVVTATTYSENTASIRVMEKLGMRLKRRFRYSPEELAQQDTGGAAPGELWDGDDLEYVLEQADFERY